MPRSIATSLCLGILGLLLGLVYWGRSTAALPGAAENLSPGNSADFDGAKSSALIDAAAASLERLDATPSSRPEPARSQVPQLSDAAEDPEWGEFAREPDLNQVYGKARTKGVLDFRAVVLNRGDTYIPAPIREQFSADLQSAVEHLNRLGGMRMELANNQVLQLVQGGAFHKHGDIFVYGEPKKVGDAGPWHILSAQDGKQYHIRWSDLTAVGDVDEALKFLEGQFEASIVDFFYRTGVLDAARRDALLQYWVGDGDQELRKMAVTNPDRYRWLREMMFGQ